MLTKIIMASVDNLLVQAHQAGRACSVHKKSHDLAKA